MKMEQVEGGIVVNGKFISDYEIESSSERYFSKRNRKHERHKRKYFKIFTTENINKIYTKNRHKNSYYSRNMDLLMDVLFEYAEECGSEVKYGSDLWYKCIGDDDDFTSAVYLIGDFVVELVSGQGSFIALHNLDESDKKLIETIRYVYRCNGYVDTYISGKLFLHNEHNNKIHFNMDSNDLTWDYIVNACKIADVQNITTDKIETLLKIQESINSNKE